MSIAASGSDEKVIREFPNITYWWEGHQLKGMGNLILTDERLVFLAKADINPKQIERWNELSGKGTRQQIDFAVRLSKDNFQIPLDQVVSVRNRLTFNFVFPGLCMRVLYRRAAGKGKAKSADFQFKVTLLRKLFQSGFPTLEWTGAVKKALKARGSGLAKGG